MKTFRQWLEEKKACESARKWVGDKTLEQAWNECSEPWWIVWLIAYTLSNIDTLRNYLLRACFKDKHGNYLILGNPAATCDFLRNLYSLEQIKQAIGEDV